VAICAVVALSLGFAFASPVLGQILQDHPRLFMDQARLAELKAKACYDANGNPVPGCTPTADWTRYYNMVQQYVGGGDYYGATPWHFALVYRITGDVAYANRAIGLAMDQIAAGMDPVRFDSYLYVRDKMRNVALTYDWCYDLLTPAQRTAIIDYMNQAIYEVWNPDNPDHPWSGWGVDNPFTGYFYSFILATAFNALATWGENPQASGYLDIVYDKLDNIALPFFHSRGEGGGWHDGSYYSWGAKRYTMEIFQVLAAANGRDYFEITDFPKQCAMLMLYVVQPDNFSYYGGGDIPDPRETEGLIETARWLMLQLAYNLRGTTESRYAQYWVNHVFPQMDLSYNSPWDFLLAEPTLPEQFWDDLPLSYHAPGWGFVNARSGWDSDAVSITLISTVKIASHQNFNQNSFTVFKNGWQFVEANVFGGANSHGIAQGTEFQNTMLFNNTGQRLWGFIGNDLIPSTGVITQFEDAGEYAYVVGDASEAYNTRTDEILDYYEREIVFVRPDLVFVFDRTSTTNAGFSKKWIVHTKNQPTINNNQTVCQNFSGKVFMQTLLPDNPSLSKLDERSQGAFNTWRITLSPASARVNDNFLNVIYAADQSASQMPPTVKVDSEAGNMVGAHVTYDGEDKVLMFSTDPRGGTPSGSIIYQVGQLHDGRHMLFGLEPDTEYSVDVSLGAGFQRIKVERGAGRRTSDLGVLCFDVRVEPAELASSGD
jgi:hypothetical protein